ncbi:beta-ketoacyl synthase N-terminal-like domain-containing protein [Mixta intestinalis]|nr:beta-ketoacyl synthase [Mixta intestinalis]
MSNATMIAGYSVCLPFAENSHALIEQLRQGKRVEKTRWFKTDDEAIKSGFKYNRYVARLQCNSDLKSVLALLDRLIDNALVQAGLDKTCLSGENVRVYLTGLGPRTDARDYKNFYDRNDIEDVKLVTSVMNLHVEKMSQDGVSHHIASRYRLKYQPPNMNCTSNSALAALHIGRKAIEQGDIDLVMVINCSEIKTQDCWFLENNGMLDSEVVQPFGENSKGVLFAEGYSVMLLESGRHRRARQRFDGVQLRSTYVQISANRSNDAAYLSLSLLKAMNGVMLEADISCHDLAAIIPHGNGSDASDKAEAKALGMLLSDKTVPVLAYKGQIGYTTTGSGLVDLIIAHHTLLHNELLSPVSNDEIIKEISSHLLVDCGAVQHNKSHLLKTGVGVDGSIIAMVISHCDRQAG